MKFLNIFNRVKTEQPEYVLTAKQPCSCGSMSYGSGGFSDLVHCNNCGCVYFIHSIKNPVARYEIESTKEAA